MWVKKENYQNLSTICFTYSDWINLSPFAENSWIVNGIEKVPSSLLMLTWIELLHLTPGHSNHVASQKLHLIDLDLEIGQELLTTELTTTPGDLNSHNIKKKNKTIIDYVLLYWPNPAYVSWKLFIVGTYYQKSRKKYKARKIAYKVYKTVHNYRRQILSLLCLCCSPTFKKTLMELNNSRAL